ncbi:MAG: acetyl-CoA carboxylase biotin carboxyl carrier protein subunit [Bryobacterales bacterium]|nr:acetyl-CoA carboxylase biotin carboxyl carrier protein subunit [Bryobacterales bacterium]
MKRHVVVNGRSGTIEIEGSRLRYEREDGVVIEREFSLQGTSVLLNGRSYRVNRGAGKEVWVNGRLLSMEVFDPRDLRTGKGASANHGRQEIAASMPGKVIRVLVTAGDTVEEGQGLVVVEAMKMQNEMKSPKTGRVAEVRARLDATVGAGEILVIVE